MTTLGLLKIMIVLIKLYESMKNKTRKFQSVKTLAIKQRKI